ncbi:hypothetical protein MKY09_05340 [Psychrobacillus sp. FSL K6-4046]|uniref:hypothetical protein n=1 Tax=Psychrobacillus sp. FSL K6-4046 TaxID=2921550 RepID=UPI00315AC021
MEESTHTLGLDENNSPVIIEYKRARNEKVINQGLYYLDWLLDLKAEFELMTLRRFGPSIAENIDWSSPRLLCIAGNFTKFDEHAVQQIIGTSSFINTNTIFMVS